MSAIKIISLNVKGLNKAIKRKKIISWLKREKVHIAFLEETHLTDSVHEQLKTDWIGQVYYSSFSSNKRGVAIIINKNTPFLVEHYVKDTEGRYVLISGSLNGEHFMLGCVYAPNVFNNAFYSKLLADLSPLVSP